MGVLLPLKLHVEGILHVTLGIKAVGLRVWEVLIVAEWQLCLFLTCSVSLKLLIAGAGILFVMFWARFWTFDLTFVL